MKRADRGRLAPGLGEAAQGLLLAVIAWKLGILVGSILFAGRPSW